MWTCPTCAETIEGSFEVCWNCGTSVDGQTDPDFASADDMAPIVNAPEDLLGVFAATPEAERFEIDPGDEFAGRDAAPLNLVECYWAKNAIEARFVAEQLMERGVPAISDGELLGSGLSAAAWGSPYFQPRVRVRSADLPRARQWIEMYENRRPSAPSEAD